MGAKGLASMLTGNGEIFTIVKQRGIVEARNPYVFDHDEKAGLKMTDAQELPDVFKGIRVAKPSTMPKNPDTPALAADLQPEFDTTDGEVRAPIPIASAVSATIGTIAAYGEMATVETGGMGAGRLWITDSRVIFMESEPTTEGYVGVSPGNPGYMAGHVRYPWIISVAYQPKSGLFGVESLVLDCFSSIPNKAFTGLIVHRVSVGFPKGTDGAHIAHQVARLAGAHNEKFVETPRTAEAFHAVATIGPPPKPKRGQMMPLIMPASVHYPGVSEGPWEIQTDDSPIAWGI